jgi:Carbohydrate binding domain./F5/8 type C domain.
MTGSQTASATPTTYYVATTGSDSNDGTSLSAPFLTVQKCADVAQAGDTCEIRGGTYRETVTPANSGRAGAPITFTSYNGETVTLSGADAVTGWTLDSGSVYWAPMTWDLGSENQVFVNGSAMDSARWPNQTGTNLQPTDATVGSGTTTTLTDSAIPDGDWTGATLHIAAGAEWIWQSSTVSSYDSVTHTLTFPKLRYGGISYYDPSAGNIYYLSGVRSALDAANEYWYDTADQRLYVWVPGGGVPSGVEAKHRSTAFNLDGRSYIDVTGLQTFAANITTDDQSNDNTLDHLDMTYVYYDDVNNVDADQDKTGIVLNGSYNLIRDSEIQGSTGNLVTLSGYRNDLVNNHIHDGGWLPDWDGLVSLQGDSSLVSNNTINDCGRACISWTNNSDIGLERNLIQYNDVYDGMWLTNDGGLLYSGWDDSENSRITHNWIHDAHPIGGSGSALYLDAWNQNWILDHNVIWGAHAQILLNAPDSGTLVYNNTVASGSIAIGADYGVTNDSMFETEVFNNIDTGLSDQQGVTSGANITDPTFVDAANNDYHLQAGSDGIDAGVVEDGITDGYVGAAPDAGAYEYGGDDWQWTPGYDAAASPQPVYASTTTHSSNKIATNAGFERGNLTDWTTTGAGTATAVFESADHDNPDTTGMDVAGRWGVQLGGSSAADGIERTISGLTPGDTYQLSVWVRSESGATAQLTASDFGGADVNTTDSSSTWTHLVSKFTMGSTSTAATVELDKLAGDATDVYADVFQLKDVSPDGVSNSGYSPIDAASATASTTYSTYSPDLAIDGNVGTRWNGDGSGYPQWLQLDLGSAQLVGRLNTWFYDPAGRTYTYEIDTSTDGRTYTPAVTTATSSDSSETVDTFTPVSARYVRITMTGVSPAGDWPAIYEAQAMTPSSYTPLTATSAIASSTYQAYVAGDAIDGDLATRWNADGPTYPQSIKLDLGSLQTVGRLTTWFYDPAERTYTYDIATSEDDRTYTTVVSSASSSSAASTDDTFTPVTARYILLTFTGVAPAGDWAAIDEMQAWAPS